MGAIDPQLAQLAAAEEEANADLDATKQIPSLSQAVPPQPQHPVRALVTRCIDHNANVRPAGHAGSVPFVAAARADVPRLWPSHGICRAGAARTTSEDCHCVQVL
jgi:hypothetical protein